jgi:hypothetical protein
MKGDFMAEQQQQPQQELSFRALVTFLLQRRDTLNTQDAIDSMRPDYRVGQLNFINGLLNDLMKFPNVLEEVRDMIAEEPTKGE